MFLFFYYVEIHTINNIQEKPIEISNENTRENSRKDEKMLASIQNDALTQIHKFFFNYFHIFVPCFSTIFDMMAKKKVSLFNASY